MRIEFISRLALLLVAGFLVVASQVWIDGTLEWLFIAGGIMMIALAALGLARQRGMQRPLDGMLGLLGVWSIVQAIVFNGSTLQWVSFGTAIAGVVIGTIGLMLHEMTTERVVHELSVMPTEGRVGHPSRA
jgi:peptidoglycan/LPS O-acetylase OafA/YrhL